LIDVWRSTSADDYGDFYFNGEYTGNDFAEFLPGGSYFTYVTHTPPNYDGAPRTVLQPGLKSGYVSRKPSESIAP